MSSIRSVTKVDERVQKELTKKEATVCRVLWPIGAAAAVGYLVCAGLFDKDPALHFLFVIWMFAAVVLLAVPLAMLSSVRASIRAARKDGGRLLLRFRFDEEGFDVEAERNFALMDRKTFRYREITRVRETEEYLFLCTGARSAFPVRKDSMNEGELSQLKTWLAADVRVPVRAKKTK